MTRRADCRRRSEIREIDLLGRRRSRRQAIERARERSVRTITAILTLREPRRQITLLTFDLSKVYF